MLAKSGSDYFESCHEVRDENQQEAATNMGVAKALLFFQSEVS